MTDTVQTPATENTTGNEGTNAAPAANNANEGAQAPENAVPQSDGQNESSANPEGKDTPENGDGKVTEADKDNTSDDGAKEGGDQTQKQEIDAEKLKWPEGVTVTDEQKQGFLKEAEKFGVKDQEGAQRFLDWVLENSERAKTDLAKQQEKEVDDLEARWVEAAKKDPVIGKEYDKNIAEATRTMSELFSPQVVEFLNDSRFAKNPEFIKDLLRISKERADATLVAGRQRSAVEGIKRDSMGNPMLTFK